MTSSGKIKAVGAGKATITVTSGSKKGIAKITVQAGSYKKTVTVKVK